MGGQIAAFFQKAGIPCLFHLVTGAYCPGCGGTRAAKALVTGHIFQSLRYNPVVFYGAAVAAAFGLAWLYCRLRRRSAPGFRQVEVFLYGGLILAFANCIFKNYMLFVKGVDLLS